MGNGALAIGPKLARPSSTLLGNLIALSASRGTYLRSAPRSPADGDKNLVDFAIAFPNGPLPRRGYGAKSSSKEEGTLGAGYWHIPGVLAGFQVPQNGPPSGLWGVYGSADVEPSWPYFCEGSMHSLQ